MAGNNALHLAADPYCILGSSDPKDAVEVLKLLLEVPWHKSPLSCALGLGPCLFAQKAHQVGK
eukprot:1464341-Amphidinium_carterae.1